MESLKNNKILLSVLVISFLVFAVYKMDGGINNGVDVGKIPNYKEQKIASDILLLLNKMQQVSIEKDFFTSTSWTSLVDYSVALPDDLPGRADLFSANFFTNNIVPNKATSTLP